ncbi:MAG: hypothetical protein AAFZ18_20975 [Myxococcota bacterium]
MVSVEVFPHLWTDDDGTFRSELYRGIGPEIANFIDMPTRALPGLLASSFALGNFACGSPSLADLEETRWGETANALCANGASGDQDDPVRWRSLAPGEQFVSDCARPSVPVCVEAGAADRAETRIEAWAADRPTSAAYVLPFVALELGSIAAGSVSIERDPISSELELRASVLLDGDREDQTSFVSRRRLAVETTSTGQCLYTVIRGDTAASLDAFASTCGGDPNAAPVGLDNPIEPGSTAGAVFYRARHVWHHGIEPRCGLRASVPFCFAIDPVRVGSVDVVFSTSSARGQRERLDVRRDGDQAWAYGYYAIQIKDDRVDGPPAERVFDVEVTARAHGSVQMGLTPPIDQRVETLTVLPPMSFPGCEDHFAP